MFVVSKASLDTSALSFELITHGSITLLSFWKQSMIINHWLIYLNPAPFYVSYGYTHVRELSAQVKVPKNFSSSSSHSICILASYSIKSMIDDYTYTIIARTPICLYSSSPLLRHIFLKNQNILRCQITHILGMAFHGLTFRFPKEKKKIFIDAYIGVQYDISRKSKELEKKAHFPIIVIPPKMSSEVMTFKISN